MVANLKFESAAGTATAALDQVKIIILEDGTGNKYTLDTTANNLKVAYTPNGGQAKEYTVDGLAAALGKLLTIDGSTAGKSILAEEVAKKPVVEAIFDAKDGNDKISETKVGATFAKKTDLDNKANIDGSNATEAGVNAMLGKLTDKVLKNSELSAKVSDKAVVEAIFDAKDGNDKISETKVGATFAKKTDLDNKANIDGSNATEAGVNAMLGKLTDKVLKNSELSAKVSDKAVVEAIFDAKDGNDKISETKVGATFAKKTDLDNKANIDGSNATEAGVNAMLGKLTDKVLKNSELSAKVSDKAVVEAIFDAKDGRKSILVEKLGGFLDAPETLYGAQGNQAAKAFLAEKGLKPTPEDVATELVKNPSFQASAKIAVNAQDAGFQEAVKAVMSQPSFEVPTDSSSPLSWDW